MFSPAHQSHFSLTIDGIEHDFQVLAFNGEEAISRPYFFNVALVSERADLTLESLVDLEAFLSFDNQGNGIHGRIYHIVQSADEQHLQHYNLALVPHLSYLRHRINQRIYQQFSVPKIIALVLEEHGIVGNAYRFHLGSTYPARDHCTQYGETDLHFVQRLCEEEGIHFHFQHSAHDHVLVFTDDQAAFPRIGQTTAFGQAHDRVANQPLISRLNLRVGPLTRRQAEGHSDQTRLASGHVLEISGHPRQALNAPWLLTQVIHEGKQPQVSGENVASGNPDNEDDFQQGYRNRFMALPWDLTYRPPLAHDKPQVSGNQTAVVIAVEDEEKRLGRVKVKLPWDRDDRFDDKSSCWLRVASHWDCEMTSPRAGMEVMVTFFESDPDQPLVSGCLCCR
ncbi:type VI secretion system tip protein VgrG [Pseudomonas tructae]|uniref:Type VI secretion system tip protein VgrG n=1 Tax=Pseudomonas tructae TaxID=2518644 RepID=A0A411MHJ7_9PSED|nr:type VI secretion system tip protein TssI/VgrG [Pseudomonas tructae]QBF26277.1 type VI secretion system tip protein VgrG [Pseudomonas tructae]